MSISIRRATKEDCKAILGLINELAVYEKAPQEVTIQLEKLEETGFGEKPIWWSFVAEKESNGEIVGFALYYIRFSTWKGPCMYLEDLYVKESERKSGIGQQLLDTLFAEAKEKKLVRVIWQVLEWNEPAIKFYEKNKASLDPEWINCSVEIV